MQQHADLHATLLALRADDSETRTAARNELRRRKSEWRQQWLESFVHADSAIRVGAASAVNEFGGFDSVVVDALIRSLTDDHQWVRYEACWSLDTIGEQTPDLATAAISQLVALFHDESWNIRQAAIEAAATIGHADLGLVELIAPALCDKCPNVRASAASSLARFRRLPQPIELQLEAAKSDPEWMVSKEATEALAVVRAR